MASGIEWGLVYGEWAWWGLVHGEWTLRSEPSEGDRFPIPFEWRFRGSMREET